MEKLDAAAIALPGAEVRVVERCTSTNDLLLKERIGERAVLLVAEEQTAGRGRRGRRWHSAPGAGITFSLARRVRRPARELPALSLVAGVAVARALHGLGVGAARLKWPNDLVVDGAKLGGILVETRGAGHAVIGIGLNHRRTPGLEAKVRRKLAFIEELRPVLRSRVIRDIGLALMEALDRFDERGLDALRADWEAMDAHAGQRLRVRLADGRTLSGIAAGLGEDGALRIHTKRGMRTVASGRVVSARAA
ncbi:MAG TPA: biotin--[acetyl-CoA-carboxylase] ligase [Burkholderiales bacterium]|jgi:BirA family transcriptional regulator, biotin operon repressor / biotin---[acetyl-CoA-carboxylase] ligase|nr:biotin--[acetyl-CoA-carboxylase] ligase [Burkholderiales bacterium]